MLSSCYDSALRHHGWVEVGREGGDVPHVGVVHQGAEGDGATVEEVEDLGLHVLPVRGDGFEFVDNRNQVRGVFQHVDANFYELVEADVFTNMSDLIMVGFDYACL